MFKNLMKTENRPLSFIKGDVSVLGYEINVGVKGDVANIEYTKDDGLEIQTKLEGGIVLDIGPFDLGPSFSQTHNYGCPCGFIGECPYNNYQESLWQEDSTFEIYGKEFYLLAGVSFNLRFNYETFAKGWIEIYEE